MACCALTRVILARRVRISVFVSTLSVTLPGMEKGGFVYILSSKGRRLYTGVTARLQFRVGQHKAKSDPKSFTARYNIDRLVYYEAFGTIQEAIGPESAIKNMHRTRKIELIVGMNPTWKDLSDDWGKPIQPFDERNLRPPVTFPNEETG